MNYPAHPEDGIIDHSMIWLEKNGAWYQRPRNPAELAAFKTQAESMVRVKRDQLMRDSDIMVMIDRWDSYSSEQQSAWRQYRQQLRDLPGQAGFPYTLTWPTSPQE